MIIRFIGELKVAIVTECEKQDISDIMSSQNFEKTVMFFWKKIKG